MTNNMKCKLPQIKLWTIETDSEGEGSDYESEIVEYHNTWEFLMDEEDLADEEFEIALAELDEE